MSENLIKRIRTDKGDCPIDYNALANRPDALKSPSPIKIVGGASAEYDGSSAETVNIPSVPEWAKGEDNPSYTKAESDARYESIEASIRPTANGNPAVCSDSIAWSFQGLKVYGKSTQDGTPSPENPVPIVSAGDGGNIELSMTGKNLLNMGEAFASGWNVVGFKNFLIPGKTYCFTNKLSAGINFAVFLSATAEIPWAEQKGLTDYIPEGSSVSFVAPNDSRNFPFLSLAGGNAGINQIFPDVEFQIEPGSIATTYNPYIGQSITLSTPNGLPGIPVDSGGNYTDSTGQQWGSDVIDLGSGIGTTMVAKATLDANDSTLTMMTTSDPQKYRIRSYLLRDKALYPSTTAEIAGIVSATFKTVSATNLYLNQEVGISLDTVGSLFIYSDQFNTNDITPFKEFLADNPIKILYVAKSPITTPLSAEEIAAYRALTTYSGTTVVSTAEPVAGIEARYVADGDKYLQSITDRISALESAQSGI